MSKTPKNQPSAEKQESEDSSKYVPGVEKIARATTLEGKPHGIALRVNGETLFLKFETALPNSQYQLHKWLLENNLDQLRREWAGLQIGPRLLERSSERIILVAERRGFHEWMEGKEIRRIYVWNGKVHSLGEKHKRTVVPIEQGSARTTERGDPQLLLKVIEEHCFSHPRVLVAGCYALSAPLRRLCQVPVQLLVLSGASGTGKSSTQRLLMAMAGPAKLERAENSTPMSMQEALSRNPDMPVFFDEMTKEKSGKALKNFMLVAANGAGRGRSEFGPGGGKVDPIEATPIISTNKTVEFLIDEQKLPDEIRARVFTISVDDDHPMFEKELVASPVRHGKELHRIANANFGGVWDSYIEAIGPDAQRILKRAETRVDELATQIAKRAGFAESALDETSKRVLDGVAFSAFAGQMATRSGFWEIRTKTILNAFALVFGEHMQSLPPTEEESDAEIIEQVCALIVSNLARFDDFELHSGGRPKAGCVGWIGQVDGERCYLWEPAIFEEKVAAKKIKGDVYGALKRAGYLKVSDGSEKNAKPHRLQKRIPGHPAKARGTFIAILDRIRYVQDER